jgi:hypothetical protein
METGLPSRPDTTELTMASRDAERSAGFTVTKLIVAHR